MSADNEKTLEALIILAIGLVALYRTIRWVMEAIPTKNPWNPEIEELLQRGQAPPLCLHCLLPQEHDGWFCPECGSTVGPYCNYLPYVYIFSQGEVLRSGVTAPVRRDPLLLLGYVLFSFTMFSILAPIYWFLLFRNLARRVPAEPPAETTESND